MNMRRPALLLLCSLLPLLSACQQPGLQIDDSLHAADQNSRVDYIILHYTSTDLARSQQLLTSGGVSAHYLLPADGRPVYRLVDENRRAWHAGDSSWQGRSWLNASSIGIEMVNDGYRDLNGVRQWQPYPDAQIDALILLLRDIQQRHGIAGRNILGHSDVAPQRKVDPGPLFPWKRLADAGLIPWPDASQVARQQALFSQQLPQVLWFQQQLARIGYSVTQNGELDQATRNVIAAFQMKYRPARCDGQPDAQTAALLAALP